MNKIIQLKDVKNKYFPIVKTEVATAKLNTRYKQYQSSPWQRVKVNLNDINSSSTRLTLVDNGIKIGKRVKKVLVSGQIAFWRNDVDAIDYFEADINVNDKNITYCTHLNQQAFQVSAILTPILVEVKEGDVIRIFSNYGYNTNKSFYLLENGTYLTVEVVE